MRCVPLFVCDAEVDSAGAEENLLLAHASVAVHELVDASGGVDELALTGVEGVRAAGNFQFHYGVFFSLKLHCLRGFAGALREEHVAVAHVLEHYRAIILRMNVFFHFFIAIIILLSFTKCW
jgi:hypothetical protein